MLLLAAGNVGYVWDYETANQWPASKASMPFGQLPVLKVSTGKSIVTLAQSGAISRYCAKVAGLWPNNDLEAGFVDGIMEQCTDIFNGMAKAKYAGDEMAQKKAWEEFTNIVLPAKLQYIENMIVVDKETVNAADVAVFSIMNLVERAGVSWRGQSPNVVALYDRVQYVGTIPEYLKAEYPPYFSVV